MITTITIYLLAALIMFQISVKKIYDSDNVWVKIIFTLLSPILLIFILMMSIIYWLLSKFL